MKAGVHCSHPTGWLANPPRNGAMLGAQRWPLRVLCRGGRQICFVEGECVASFPAAKAILQAPGYPTDTHGMGQSSCPPDHWESPLQWKSLGAFTWDRNSPYTSFSSWEVCSHDFPSDLPVSSFTLFFPNFDSSAKPLPMNQHRPVLLAISPTKENEQSDMLL